LIQRQQRAGQPQPHRDDKRRRDHARGAAGLPDEAQRHQPGHDQPGRDGAGAVERANCVAPAASLGAPGAAGCRLPRGKYKFTVTASDGAANVSLRPASNYLRVF